MKITDQGEDGATVAFEYDAALIAALKEAFPKARFDRDTKVWSVPGKLAFSRVSRWAEPIEAAALEARKAREAALAAADFEGRRETVDPVAALAARRGEIKSKRVQVQGAVAIYPFTYSEEAVAVAKASRAKYDAETKCWRWIAREVGDVAAIIEAVNRIFEIATAQAARIKREREAQQAEWKAEREARQAERPARYCEFAEKAPPPGATVRLWKNPVTVLSLGKTFRGGDDLSSMGGPVGAEGEWVRYVYYREATAEEIAALEAEEAAAAARAEREKARRSALYTLSHSDDCPEVGSIPEGETLWLDDAGRIYGHERRVVLTPDGWLWHVVYDGSDGAAWGEYNCGYNTRGTRLPATPELIAAIKGEG